MSQLTYPDLLCVDDFDPMGEETTSDLQNYEQDIYHLLVQPRGSNPANLDGGVGLDAALSSSMTDLALKNLVVAEVLNDPRTVNATATVSRDGENVKIALEADTDDDHLATGVSINQNGTTLGGVGG